MLGIALGAFAQGFSQGIDLGDRIRGIRKQHKLESDVEGITQEGKAQYDADVAAGTAEPGDFMSRYANEMVPLIANRYLEEGDPAKAQAWVDWAESSTTKRAAKKFTSGLGKLQSGDIEGGIADMTSAANTKGYGIDGKLSAAEYYDEEAGQVTGYRLTFNTPDGKEHTKNVAVDDLASFFSNLANPQAAFEMQEATKAAESKADLEVRTHVRKKAAEAELGVGTGALTQAQYQNAVQEERKRIEESALLDEEVGAMTPEQREAMAKQIVDARFGRGGAAPAEPQVAVDPDTGQQVQFDTPASDAAAPAPADEEQPTDEQLGVQAPLDEVSQAPAAAPAEPIGGQAASPVDATSQVPDSDKQQYLAQASQAIKQGVNPQQVGQALTQAGIPPEQWPPDIMRAAQVAQIGITR
jgi:hypothetical protein